MEFRKYKSFPIQEEALDLADFLQANHIPYKIEDTAPVVDTTFVGGMEPQTQYVIQIRPGDFRKVDSLLKKQMTRLLNSIPSDHYLFEFSNQELLEILGSYGDWNQTDYLLAQKILRDRGEDITDEYVEELKLKKLEKIRKPEKGHLGWLIFGYVSASLGGLLGIFIGWHHAKFKRTIFTGEKVFNYDENTRNHGYRIFYIGLLCFTLIFAGYLFDMF